MGTKRKPHNDLAGYVCELKSKHPELPGHFVILDRQNGADWIDGDERWVLAHMRSDAVGCVVCLSSLAMARALMKDMASGGNAVDLGQHSNTVAA